MAVKLTLKKSSVAAKDPVAGDLDYGELAINYNDGKLFYKNSSNEIKWFIDSDAIASAIAAGGGGGGGSPDSYILKGTVDLTSAGAQSIGTMPANADVLRTTLKIDTKSDTVTTVTVGDATNGADSYMAAAENDPQLEDSAAFVSYNTVYTGAGNKTANATVATPGTVGSATCFIEYKPSGV